MRPLDTYGPTRMLPRPGNRFEVRMLNAPTFHPLEQIERWKPKTTTIMQERMADFLQSPYGHVVADVLTDRMTGHGESIRDLDVTITQFSDILLEQMTKPIVNQGMVIFAHDDFAQMMNAAAITAPQRLIKPHELLADSGFLYFETEQNLTEIADVYQPVRAISWSTNSDHTSQSDRRMLQVFIWCEGHHRAEEWDNLSVTVGAPREINYAMHVCGFSFTPIDQHMTDQPIEKAADRHGPIIGLIRAIGAIASSPASIQQDAAVKPRTKKKKRRGTSSVPSSVRILSLHNPDHGRYELDAATGRRVRAHWVRGHWRNQWYAKDQEHRIIWIDGFAKGDAERGIITAPKVYVARGPKEDDIEETEEATA